MRRRVDRVEASMFAPQLWFEPLFKEELRLVVAASHPLSESIKIR